jgi:hypothetical protein
VPQYLLNHFDLNLCLVQAGGKPASKSVPAVPFPFFDYGCHLSADQVGQVKWCAFALQPRAANSSFGSPWELPIFHDEMQGGWIQCGFLLGFPRLPVEETGRRGAFGSTLYKTLSFDGPLASSRERPCRL